MSLLVNNSFKSHSGLDLDFKIDCDALTDFDLETLASIVSKKYSFSDVFGIPMGGLRFAAALDKYCTKNSFDVLVVDDVMTTGNSFRDFKNEWFLDDDNVIGITIFSRGYKNTPEWVNSIFTLNSNFN
jgi:orotate phosphoribosyltransferase-like protein